MFVWIASYPKSGNTWMRMMLDSLREGGRPVDINALSLKTAQASSRAPFDAAIGLDSSDLSPAEIEALRAPALARRAGADALLFSKIHDAWRVTGTGEELFAKKITQGTLYIVRDPRDVAVSFAHHAGMPLDAAIGAMADPGFTLAPPGKRLGSTLPQPLLSWSGHVESWLDLSGHAPLLLRYEDMHADPVRALRLAAERIGWRPEPRAIRDAVEHTRFERLAEQERRSGFRERMARDRVFFRQGKAGGWRDALSPAQARRIEADHGKVMARLGYS